MQSIGQALDSYIAGYVDGEGCFAVSVQRNPSCRLGFQLVPEFRVSQNGDRAEVLAVIQQRLAAGYIKRNSRKDRALVLVVRERRALLASVIPFFETTPLISAKYAEFERFARVVRAMGRGEHLTEAGFAALLDVALSMNGGGQFRQVRWSDVVAAAATARSGAVRDQPVVPERVDDATLS